MYGQDEHQNVQVSDEIDKEEDQKITPGDLLAAVLSPERLESIIASNSSVQGIYDSMSDQQKRDMLFLGSSYAFSGATLEESQKVLKWMKENEREITYEDLVKMSFYAPGELERAGRHLAGIINLEYDQVYDKDASIAVLDREHSLQRGIEWVLLLAKPAAQVASIMFEGPALAPKDMYNPDSYLDSIEWKGWSVKGPQSFMKSPEVVGNPAGQAAGTKEKIISTGDIDYRQSSLDKAFSKHSSDFGTYPDGSNTSIELFKSDINELLETGMQKSGTYRATPGTHVFNSSTHQWAFYDSNGNFITAFKLSPDQFRYLSETGVVK